MLAEVKRGFLVVLGLVLAFVVAKVVVDGSGDDPKPIAGAPKEVAGVVARLERATQRHEFDILCDQLFTRSARERAGGKDCVALLRETAKDVRDARIRLLEVKIEGSRAKARVRTTAEGQTAVEETIDLVREGGRYRISALES